MEAELKRVLDHHTKAVSSIENSTANIFDQIHSNHTKGVDNITASHAASPPDCIDAASKVHAIRTAYSLATGKMTGAEDCVKAKKSKPVLAKKAVVKKKVFDGEEGVKNKGWAGDPIRALLGGVPVAGGHPADSPPSGDTVVKPAAKPVADTTGGTIVGSGPAATGSTGSMGRSAGSTGGTGSAGGGTGPTGGETGDKLALAIKAKGGDTEAAEEAGQGLKQIKTVAAKDAAKAALLAGPKAGALGEWKKVDKYKYEWSTHR